jgi:hypothetical protein
VPEPHRVTLTVGTTGHRALHAWPLPARGVLSFDHVGAPLAAPVDLLLPGGGTLPAAALAYLEATLMSPPPYPPPATVLAGAAAAAAEALKGAAECAMARTERRRVSAVEAAKAARQEQVLDTEEVAAARAKARAAVEAQAESTAGPGGYYSSHHRTPFNSMNEFSDRV